MKLEKLIRPNILNIKPYSSAKDEYKDQEGIFFDANENPFESNFNRYPDPNQTLLKQFISKFKLISPDQILIGNGSNECIELIIKLFCTPGKDKIQTLYPTYAMYQQIALIQDVQCIETAMKKDFTFPIDEVLHEGHYSKVLFLCSPNNPTGQLIPIDVVERILSEYKGIVVLDEAYIDFAAQKSMLSVLNKYPNLIIIQTFSKGFGMAGLRLGMLFASKKIVHYLNTIKLPYNINQLSQNEAIERLKNLSRIENQIRLLNVEKKRLINEFKGIRCIKKCFPSDANFLLIRVDNADEMYDFLKARKIIVRKRNDDQLLKNCLRISIGKEVDNNQLILAIKKYQQHLERNELVMSN